MIDINTPQSAIVVCEEKSPFPEFGYHPVTLASLEKLWVSLMDLRKDNWTKPEMLRVWIKLDAECAPKPDPTALNELNRGTAGGIERSFSTITRPADAATPE